MTDGFTSDADRREFYAAKSIWHRRHELTPAGRIPWAQWFKQRFGRSLERARQDFYERFSE